MQIAIHAEIASMQIIAIHAEIAIMQIIAIHAEIVTLHDVARASLLLPKMKQSSASGAVDGKRYFV